MTQYLARTTTNVSYLECNAIQYKKISALRRCLRRCLINKQSRLESVKKNQSQ